MGTEFKQNLVGVLHTPLLFLLEEDVLQLSITCKDVFHELSTFISNNILFRYPGDNNTFQCHKPQRLKVGGFFGASPDNKYLSQVKLTPKHLEFHPDLLPSTLTHLTFGPNFNSPIDNLLPHSLTHLSFEVNKDGVKSYFNQSIDHLPPSLTHLTLPPSFNQQIDHLPHSLAHLTLSTCINQSIDHLPPSIVHLTISRAAAVKGLTNLPATLTHLTLEDYTITCDDALPRSLKYLKVYSIRSGFTLPNLTSLHCISIANDLILPDSLVELHTSSILPSFPPKIQILTHYTSSLHVSPPLPSSPLFLKVSANIQQILPSTLQTLYAFGDTRLQLPLPSSLTLVHLDLDKTPRGLPEHVLTLPNLTELYIKCTWSPWTDPANRQPIILPPKLKKLTLHNYSGGEHFTGFFTRIQFSSAPQLGSLSILNYTCPLYECSSEYPHLPILTSLHLANVVFQGPLPPSILHFTLESHSTTVNFPPLHNNLITLHCRKCNLPPSFPSQLKYLNIIHSQGRLPPLPPGLLDLYIEKSKIGGLLSLPSSLRNLHTCTNITSAFIFPPHLKTVSCVRKKGMEIPGLPLTIEKIEILEEDPLVLLNIRKY